MHVKTLLAFGLVIATTTSAVSAGEAGGSPKPFFLFSDTTVGYRHEFTATAPGVGETAKEVLTLTHFDAWAYGTNFFNVDWLFSDNNDPAHCALGGACEGTQGATEVYALYRGTLSFNALTRGDAFKLGPIKDAAFSFGADWNSENNSFAPAKKDLVAGIQLQFAVPGYFNAAVHAYKEWNHNGLPGTIESDVAFDVTPELEFVYMQPLNFTGLPLRFSGFTNIVFPKGKDGFGGDTVTEVLSDNRLTLDIGQLVAKRPNSVDAFVGYKYWDNKYGNDSDLVVGSLEKTWYIGAAWHMP
jgi:nucleoside-specific outer membrane channel protein Tsx